MGIEGLDDVLCGGVPRNRIYLVKGDPGVGKTTLALQFLMEGAQLGETSLYITLSETKEELEMVADSHGWNLKKLHLFELSSMEQNLQGENENTFFHPSEVELNRTTQTLLDEVKRVKPVRVVFDSLSEMRMLAETPLRYRRQILQLKQFFAGRKCTVLLLDDRSAGARDLQIETIAHGVLSLHRSSPDYGISRRQLTIQKMRGVKFREGNHDLVIKKGGLVIFPRLVAAEHHVTHQPEPVPDQPPRRPGDRPRRRDRLDAVVGLVEGRAQQVVHGCVDDHEALAAVILHLEDAGEQHAGRGHEGASRLEKEREGKVADLGQHSSRQVKGRGTAGPLVVDTEPTADVDGSKPEALTQQRARKARDLPRRGSERVQIGHLGADVALHAHDLDPGMRARAPQVLRGTGDVDAEFVLPEPRGDVGMGAGVDVRIHAQRDGSGPSNRRGQRPDSSDLVGALGVELDDSRVQCQDDLVVGLPDTREDDPIGRESGPERGA
jgi:KaiC/GvpD/RAD55 family RecA-like ATPase